MTDEKQKAEEEELTEEQLDNVAGGLSVRPRVIAEAPTISHLPDLNDIAGFTKDQIDALNPLSDTSSDGPTGG